MLCQPTTKINGGNMENLKSHLAGVLTWACLASFAVPPAVIAQAGGVPGQIDALQARMTTVETLVAALTVENGTQAAQIASLTAQSGSQAAQITALRAEVVPVGTIIAYSAETPPPGYLECDGTTLSRADYSRLFAVIGTAFGEGDGSSTFHLPDLRGQFLRGWPHSSPFGFDPDRNARFGLYPGGASGDHVGSLQPSEFQAHTHAVQSAALDLRGGFSTVAGGNAFGPIFESTTASGGSETRPWNVAVMYAIKY
jgi:tail collar domain